MKTWIVRLLSFDQKDSAAHARVLEDLLNEQDLQGYTLDKVFSLSMPEVTGLRSYSWVLVVLKLECERACTHEVPSGEAEAGDVRD